MNLTPLLQRLGFVLIGLALAMGPIAEPRDVAIVTLTALLLLVSSRADDLVLAGRSLSASGRAARRGR